MSHENSPEFWPVLVEAGSRRYLLSGGESIASEFPFPHPQTYESLLEEAEVRLSLGRPSGLDSSLFVPDEFLNLTFDRARRAGGLRVLSLTGHPVPLELFRLHTGDSFPILHFSTPRSQVSPVPRKVFLYDNPAGEVLPEARREALEAFDILSPAVDTHFCGRTLDAEEYSRHFQSADIVVYYGHGKLISGLPAIPAKEGFIPLLPGLSRPFVIFCGCLSLSGQMKSDGMMLFPLCRVSDRKSAFIPEFLSLWAAGDRLWSAYGRASSRDLQRGDIRSLLYRWSGFYPDLESLKTKNQPNIPS